MFLEFLVSLIFLISILTPVTVISIYICLLAYYNPKKKGYDNGETYEINKDITILIPSHNEEKIISKRIENLYEYDYPIDKIKIIFIDDSNDSTTNIIKNSAEKRNNIRLINFQERMGYSRSVIAGLNESDTDIIVLNEAGSFPRNDALAKMIRHFNDPLVGAVSGSSELLNPGEDVGKIESLYLKILNFVRVAESSMDSTFYIKGEAMAVRRSLVSDIQAIHDTGSIDTSMAFLVRKKGFKCIYDPQVIFQEYAPSERSGWVKQKTIRAANWMRNLIYFKDMAFRKKYGKFGLITMPFNFLMLFVFPFFLILAFVSMFFGVLLNLSIFNSMALALGLIIGIIAVLSRNVLSLALTIELSLLRAIYQISFSKKGHDKIERVESTRRT